SYYTFQTCSYVIDVYRGKTAPQKNPFKLLLFVSFFPLMVQGPICRYEDLAPTLFGGHKLQETNISKGLTRIIWGYFKKMVVANRIAPAVIALAADTDTYKGTFVFVTMLFYAFDLYCDFTGGIDITIGIAKVLGIDVAENFNLPYFSKNIKEYWNRWHITMGTWFTDYIFYPVSVCGPMLKISKWSREKLGQKIGKRVPVYLSSLIVWFTTGLWHGAAWNFIVWGLMNFVVIMISQELEPLYAKFHSKVKIKDTAVYGIFEIVRTILLMSMIRMFDVYRNVPLTFKMVGTMFTNINLKIFADGSLLNIGLTRPDYIVLIVSFVIILTVSIVKAKRGQVFKDDEFVVRHFLLSVLLIVIIVFGVYGLGYDSTQFIYNQF
ncbi:MAG: MBOAT family protein, partial [Clostridiales bacterium]|nr:MBOAT family protein [Clostridiales bacterium]